MEFSKLLGRFAAFAGYSTSLRIILETSESILEPRRPASRGVWGMLSSVHVCAVKIVASQTVE
jgi:hypothetical protein